MPRMRGPALLHGPVIRYAITDGSAAIHPERCLDQIRRWLERGLDWIQIREKALTTRELAGLTRATLRLPNPHGSKILLSDRLDVAIACRASGVHLRGGSVTPEILRPIAPADFLIGFSCHSEEDLRRNQRADYALVSPVFKPLSKVDSRIPLGLPELSRLARLSAVPLIALGGITHDNAQDCIGAGAAGVAGITLFSD